MTDSQTLQTILEYVQKIDSDVQELKKNDELQTNRLNKIGLSVARMEDDTPTIKEFDKLEKRVAKLETQISKN